MPEAAAGAGAAGKDESNTGGGGAGSHAGPTDEGRGVARRLLQKHRGRAEEALAVVADENKDLRVERRELREKLAKFEGTDVVVLRGDDLKLYAEFKALGKKPEDIKKDLDEVGTLRTKVTDGERRTAAHDAAKLLGWNADAFAAMASDKRLDVSLVDGKDAKGAAIKIPHVKPAGDEKATPVAASDWVSANASYLMPSLTTKPAGTTAAGGPGTQNAGTKGTTGTQFVEQGTNNTGGTNTDAAKPAAIPGRRNYVLPSQRAAAEKKA